MADRLWGRWEGKPPVPGSTRPVRALYNAFDRDGVETQVAR
jgi:hypothetical protein